MLAKSDQLLSNISQLCPHLEPLSPLATQGPTGSDRWKAPGWYHPLPSWKCLPSIWRMSGFWDWARLPPASPPTVLYPQEPATFKPGAPYTYSAVSCPWSAFTWLVLPHLRCHLLQEAFLVHTS